MIPEPVEVVLQKSDTQQKSLFFLGVGLLLVFIMSARSPVDSDMWWHLRSGEWMVQHGQVLLEDVFSFTRSGVPWVNHSWLAQIILFAFYSAGGAFGTSLFTAMLATTSMAFLYPQVAGKPLFKAFLIVGLTPVAAMVWSPRPQMFSLVFLSITGYILHRFLHRPTRIIWLLLPVFVIWSNLHAGYMLGILMTSAVIIGAALDHVFGWGHETLGRKDIFKLAGWTALSWMSTAINPNGINTLLIPFKTLNVDSLRGLISEWASPDFHQVVQWPFLLIIFLLFFAIGNSGRRLQGIELAILVVFTGLALYGRRNFGPFTIAVGPILSTHLWPGLQNWYTRIGRQGHGNLRILSRLFAQAKFNNEGHLPQRTWINGVVFVFLFIAGILKLAAVTSPEFMQKVEEEIYPVAAVQWILDHNPEGRMLSSYGWGGYLIWNLREYPVFIDGRTDLFDDELIQEWLAVVRASEDYHVVLDRWDIDLVLLEPDQPVLPRLSAEGWQQLYSDKQAVILYR